MILIVEAFAPIRRFLTTRLADSGFGTLAASSLSEAKQIFSSHPVKFILTCRQLPDGAANTTIRSFLLARPELKMLVMTGSVSSLPEGWPLLSKPFRVPELVQRILELDPGLRHQ